MWWWARGAEVLLEGRPLQGERLAVGQDGRCAVTRGRTRSDRTEPQADVGFTVTWLELDSFLSTGTAFFVFSPLVLTQSMMFGKTIEDGSLCELDQRVVTADSGHYMQRLLRRRGRGNNGKAGYCNGSLFSIRSHELQYKVWLILMYMYAKAISGFRSTSKLIYTGKSV